MPLPQQRLFTRAIRGYRCLCKGVVFGSALGLLPVALHAQSVAMTGSMGSKALLVIDGAAPKAVSAGQTHRGVTVVSVAPEQTVVEVGHQRWVVKLGGAPISAGRSTAASGGSQIVLTAGSGGHFFTQGSINGHATEFIVDTGATYVSMSEAEAKRLGIRYEDGQLSQANTANGVMRTYLVRLAKLRIQDVEVHDVEASVGVGSMPGVLLGNSFLMRFQMKRDNDQLTLNKRF